MSEQIHFKVLYIAKLQPSTITPAHLPSQTFHHSSKPLYPILHLSHPFSTLNHYSSQILRPSHIHHCTTFWNDLPYACALFRFIFLNYIYR